MPPQAGRQGDAGAVQHAQQRLAAARVHMDRPVHRHIQPGLGDQPLARRQQPGGQNDHQRGDHRRGDEHLGHGLAAIWPKAAKPSDINPASTKAMPRPRKPAGRSA